MGIVGGVLIVLAIPFGQTQSQALVYTICMASAMGLGLLFNAAYAISTETNPDPFYLAVGFFSATYRFGCLIIVFMTANGVTQAIDKQHEAAIMIQVRRLRERERESLFCSFE